MSATLLSRNVICFEGGEENSPWGRFPPCLRSSSGANPRPGRRGLAPLVPPPAPRPPRVPAELQPGLRGNLPGCGETSRATGTPAEAAGSGGPAFRGRGQRSRCRCCFPARTSLFSARCGDRAPAAWSGSGHRPSHSGCPSPQRERRCSDIGVTEPPSGRGEEPPGPDPPGLNSVPLTRSHPGSRRCASASVRPSRASERGWRRSEMAAAARPRTVSPQAFLRRRPPGHHTAGGARRGVPPGPACPRAVPPPQPGCQRGLRQLPCPGRPSFPYAPLNPFQGTVV